MCTCVSGCLDVRIVVVVVVVVVVVHSTRNRRNGRARDSST